MGAINYFKNSPFARNSLILFSGTMVVNILGFAFQLTMGRLVSAEVYGEVQSLVSLLNIVIVPTMALKMMANKFSAELKAQNNQAAARQLVAFLDKKIIIFGIPAILLLVLFSPWVKDFLKIKSFWPVIFVWLMILISFFNSVASGALSGWQKFKTVSVSGIIGAVVKLGSAVALILLGYRTGGIMLAVLISMLASYFILRFSLNFLSQSQDTKLAEEKKSLNFSAMRSFVLPALLGNSAIVILMNGDMLLAKHNLSAELAGSYGALSVIGKVIFFATSAIAVVLFSMSAEKHHRKEETFKIFREGVVLTLTASIGAIAVYFTFPGLVMRIFFGSHYQNAAHYLGWFAVLASLFSLVNLFLQYFLSRHQTRPTGYFLAIAVLMMLLILLYGTSIFAILKIAIGAQIAIILTSLFFLFGDKLIFSKNDS